MVKKEGLKHIVMLCSIEAAIDESVSEIKEIRAIDWLTRVELRNIRTQSCNTELDYSAEVKCYWSDYVKKLIEAGVSGQVSEHTDEKQFKFYKIVYRKGKLEINLDLYTTSRRV